MTAAGQSLESPGHRRSEAEAGHTPLRESASPSLPRDDVSRLLQDVSVLRNIKGSQSLADDLVEYLDIAPRYLTNQIRRQTTWTKIQQPYQSPRLSARSSVSGARSCLVRWQSVHHVAWMWCSDRLNLTVSIVFSLTRRQWQL